MEGLIAALAHPDARIIAGGQSLLPALLARGQSAGRLIDIRRVDALHHFSITEREIRIGSGVTLSALMASELKTVLPGLATATAFVGNRAIRNRATLGGCLAWADPRAEIPLILIAHDAEIITNQRQLRAEELISGQFRTLLQHGEVILEVMIRCPPSIAFEELIVRNSTGRAMVAVAVAFAAPESVRFSVGGLVDRAVRSDVIMQGDDREVLRAAEAFLDSIMHRFPLLADRSSAQYRRDVLPALMRRCLHRVVAM